MSEQFINLTIDNIDKEHLCCAISDKKHQVGVATKKNWLRERIAEGHIFRKLDEKGKVFIEYAPLETAWVPVHGDNYLYIYCLWVSGSFKGKGYAKSLIEYCINDAKEKGKSGICVLSSKKKKPFLADPKFLRYKGFTVCDEADNGIQLWHLPFRENVNKPEFKECAKHPRIEEKGYVLYYTNQCPFNAKYVPVAEAVAKGNNVPFRAVHLQSREDAQNAPTPITTYALFYNGEYLTNEQMNDKRFLKLLSK